MQKITVSSTFKRIAFCLVIVFLIATVSNWVLNTITTESAAMWISVGIGFGAGVFAYTKFDDWFEMN